MVHWLLQYFLPYRRQRSKQIGNTRIILVWRSWMDSILWPTVDYSSPLHHQKVCLGGWRQAQEDLWPHWGCSGPQDKDDTVCVWQNSTMLMEMLSGTAVISASTKAGGHHRDEDGFTCWASRWGRIYLSASLLELQYYLHFWHDCMTVSLNLSKSALLSRKNWS